MVLDKRRHERETARENAARARERQKRGISTRPVTVIDWDAAWDRVETIFAELDGGSVPEISNGNSV